MTLFLIILLILALGGRYFKGCILENRIVQNKTGEARCVSPFVEGRIDPVEYVGVSQQRNGDVRNINHPLCGCATLVIQKITFPL